MIKIWLDRNQAGELFRLKVTGHAESGPHGQDIVCAGVSALTQTSLLGLIHYLQHAVKYEIKSGYLMFELEESPTEQTQAVLETLVLGLSEMAQNYPQNIQIHERRR